MLDKFNIGGHACITFEALGESIHDRMKDGTPFQLDDIRHIAYQIVSAVGFLHKHKLTHTDLKPENILFERTKPSVRANKSTAIRVIDFGLATFDDEIHSKLITTRWYRAPEVFFELEWSQPCDVWSIGCVIYEMFSGRPLFDSRSSYEQLAMMQIKIGPFSARMLKTKKFCKAGKLQYGPDAYKDADEWVPLRKLKRSTTEKAQLFKLIESMLVIEPADRITLGK